jgi:hypothetical protein
LAGRKSTFPNLRLEYDAFEKDIAVVQIFFGSPSGEETHAFRRVLGIIV